MAKHINDGKCSKCRELLQGVHPTLVEWFERFQGAVLDAHVAWGHRGEKDQNDAFKKGTSKAKWGESPHNYAPALAIDLFRLTHTGAEWQVSWYQKYVGESVAKEPKLEWGGSWIKWKDFPHVQAKDWKKLVQAGEAKLPVSEPQQPGS